MAVPVKDQNCTLAQCFSPRSPLHYQGIRVCIIDLVLTTPVQNKNKKCHNHTAYKLIVPQLVSGWKKLVLACEKAGNHCHCLA